MKHFSQRALSFLLILCMLTALFAGLTFSVSAAEPTTASEVNYRTSGKYIYNWGKRDTTATFLTTYAQSYYTGSYSYSMLSSKSGTTSTSAADLYNSALGKAIHNMLDSKQTKETSYDETRTMYQYTDCQQNGNKISSFYSGDLIGPKWDGGDTWNREHTWPKSKSSNGKNRTDIMMLRPTSMKENSARGNKAYGTDSGYYDPNQHGQQLHGDVARLMLQHLLRWGDTSYFYGSGGVMQNRTILLQWLTEDPVDTWEMGRNDAVQAITGVRNVFVDYPELAFQLLSAEVPANYPTPSNGGTSVSFKLTAISGDESRGTVSVSGMTITAAPKEGNQIDDANPYTLTPAGAATVTRSGNVFTVSGMKSDCTVKINFVQKATCKHTNTKTEEQPATCTADGYVRTVCVNCGKTIEEKVTAALGHDFQNGKCTRCGAKDPNAKPVNTPKYTDFSDLPISDWYTDAVSYVLENGLMNGVSKREFDPEGELTRAMFVTILYRAEKTPDISGKTNRFTDVPANEWYTDAVVWASDNGIVTGTSHTTFEPDTPITREQIATILYRYSKAARTSQTLAAFPDAHEVSTYAYDAMCWAVAEGILNGSDGKLLPQDNATRVQIAAILMRYLEK